MIESIESDEYEVLPNEIADVCPMIEVQAGSEAIHRIRQALLNFRVQHNPPAISTMASFPSFVRITGVVGPPWRVVGDRPRALQAAFDACGKAVGPHGRLLVAGADEEAPPKATDGSEIKLMLMVRDCIPGKVGEWEVTTPPPMGLSSGRYDWNGGMTFVGPCTYEKGGAAIPALGKRLAAEDVVQICQEIVQAAGGADPRIDIHFISTEKRPRAILQGFKAGELAEVSGMGMGLEYLMDEWVATIGFGLSWRSGGGKIKMLSPEMLTDHLNARGTQPS